MRHRRRGSGAGFRSSHNPKLLFFYMRSRAVCNRTKSGLSDLAPGLLRPTHSSSAGREVLPSLLHLDIAVDRSDTFGRLRNLHCVVGD
jgi:hypothetical protein